jgi:EAL domain-containing protein (putative c-di-GMP-specific phosphodiesterase class I)
MVHAITEIAHSMGKQAIAEFAESQEIIDLLRLLGVDYAQGYGISRPERMVER